MIKVINTPCSRTAWTLDAAMTAVGWAGFLYLVAHGTMAMLNGTGSVVRLPVLGDALPTLHTLLVYLTFAAFNALLIATWILHRQRAAKRQPMPFADAVLDDDTLAAHFSLSSNQLREIQDSRVMVIHHGQNGNISFLETDQMVASNADSFQAAQAA